MPFDINERDATGQNILYVASLLGNKKLLDDILKFRVRANKIKKVYQLNKMLYTYVYEDKSNCRKKRLRQVPKQIP